MNSKKSIVITITECFGEHKVFSVKKRLSTLIKHDINVNDIEVLTDIAYEKMFGKKYMFLPNDVNAYGGYGQIGKMHTDRRTLNCVPGTFKITLE